MLPLVTPSSRLVCPDDNVTLTASNCTGTVHWLNSVENDKISRPVWQGKIRQTTAFQATCEQNGCQSNPSVATSIQVDVPVKPGIEADKYAICAGQSVQLTASGCLGNVLWTDGGRGAVRTVIPDQSTTYQAVCLIGSCQSERSEPVLISVRKAEPQSSLSTTNNQRLPLSNS